MLVSHVNPLEYLFGLEFHGHKLGLDNIRVITDALGRPQDSYPSLIVAGTNGKGSVCAMLAAALTAGGHRTGCYTSPHLVDLNERYLVDGTPVPQDAIAAVIEDLRGLVDNLLRHGRLRAVPTFFEIATATAFELFCRRGVAVAVLEVGMGGRLDATNVASPCVGVITNIDLEHQQYLGDTIAAIASEKAGIIKPGMRLVSGERKVEARDVIGQTCDDRGATLVEAWSGVELYASFIEGRARMTVRTPVREYPACVLSLRGRHQIENAIVAVRALEALDAAGTAMPGDAIVRGLEDATWPGRLDLIELGDGRRVLLDAAHNPSGARALAAYLGEVYPKGLPLVLGVVRDKDLRGMLEALLPHATRVVVTEPPTPRATPAAACASLVREMKAGTGVAVIQESDPARALDLAFAGGTAACVSGSIFLVGAVLSFLKPQKRASTVTKSALEDV
jgi:dihydrofolate synthase/folylpolyglutamate synthase